MPQKFGKNPRAGLHFVHDQSLVLQDLYIIECVYLVSELFVCVCDVFYRVL